MVERVASSSSAAGERGASLPMALAFLTGLGLAIAALFTFTSTGFRNVESFRIERTQRYAADGALEQAIAWARTQSKVGIDVDAPQSARNPCMVKTAPVTTPAAGTAAMPAVTVTCEGERGSGSGLPEQLGSTPEYSILTLGQRQNEPPPFSGPVCNEGPRASWDPLGLRGSGRREYGIRLAPARQVLSLCTAVRTVQSFDVKGKVFSNSPIVGTGTTNINLIDNGTGPNGEPRPPSEIKARGGCRQFGGATISACQAVALTESSPMDPSVTMEGHDPRTDPAATQAARDSWKLPDLSGLPKISGADVAAKVNQCGSGKTVIFEPGWYNDIGALNGLFKDNRCQTTTFWFAPARGADGKLLGTNYEQGVYYFDFTQGDGGGCNYYDAAGSTRHQWCIGNTPAHIQRVVGGTPQGWNPFATGSSSSTGLVMTDATVDGVLGTSFIWADQGNATKMDGSSARYFNPAVAVDRPLTLKNWTPKASTGAYDGSFNIKVAHRETGSRFNNPQVTVSYNSELFGQRTCGTYTLTRGNFPNTAPDQLKAADQIELGKCLNHGDKINTVQVRYSVSGCTFLCFDTAYLDGMQLIPGDYPDQPSFPRNPDDTDSGGDCSPDDPGVQFIFGGDSHVYVANGSMELCAGPSADDPVNGQQIALYGVPGVEPIRPTDVRVKNEFERYNRGSRNGSVSSGGNARRIGEPTGADTGNRANISYSVEPNDLDYVLGFAFPTVGGGAEVDVPRYQPPAGLTIDKIVMRVSYDTNGLFTGSQVDVPGCSRVTLDPSIGIPQIDGNVQRSVDVTNCFRNTLTAGSSTVTYWARSTTACNNWFGAFCIQSSWTDHLEGIEFDVSLRAINAGDPSSPVAVPNGGCLTANPNYWNVAQEGENNCAIVKADQTKDPFGPDSRGRFSVKGTIYVPSAAIDIDDEDVLYPFFSRGVVARHLMFRGFRYRVPVPLVDIPSIDSRPRPRLVTFTACIWNDAATGRPSFDPQCDPTKGDVILSRAKVRYDLDYTKTYVAGDFPTIPSVLWWDNQR